MCKHFLSCPSGEIHFFILVKIANLRICINISENSTTEKNISCREIQITRFWLDSCTQKCFNQISYAVIIYFCVPFAHKRYINATCNYFVLFSLGYDHNLIYTFILEVKAIYISSTRSFMIILALFNTIHLFLVFMYLGVVFQQGAVKFQKC